MSAAAKSIYETLLRESPPNTIVLRKASQLSNQSASGHFSRAMDELVLDFKILPVGISNAGEWHYCHIYDIVPRFYPDIQKTSQTISNQVAQYKIMEYYLHSLGSSSIKEMQRILKWSPGEIRNSLRALSKDGIIYPLEAVEMNTA